jgi:hypothetical protein
MAAAMADALKLQFIIEAVDQARGVATGIAGSVRSMARDIVGSFGGVNGAMQGFSRSYVGIATAIGGGLEIRDLIGNEDTFNRLRVNFDMTESAIDALHETIVGAAEDAKVKLSDMLGALEGFRGAGGDVAKFGSDAKTAAAAVQLLGGQGDVVGQMMAGLRKHLGIEGVDDMKRAIATLYEQTKMVPGGFAQLAPQINDLTTEYAALGHTGTQAARELGAVYAVIAEGARNGRNAGAEIRGLMSALTLPGSDLRKNLVIMGAIPDSDYTSKLVSTPITDIIKGITAFSAKSRDNEFVAARMLGPQLLHDLQSVFADIAKTGKPITLDAKLATDGDPRKFFDDAAEAAKSLTSSLNQLKDSIDEIGASWLAKPFQWLAQFLGAFNAGAGAVVALLGAISLAGNVLPWFIGGFANLGRLAMWFAFTAIPAVIGAVTTAAEVIGTASAAMLATPFGVILAGIAAVAAALYGLYELWKHWREIRDSMTAGMMTPDGGIVDPNTGIYIPGNASTAPPRAGLAPPRPGMGDRAPAFGGASPSATANNQVNGQVVVTFENAPANLMPKKAQSDNPHVDLDVDMGYNMTAVP